MSSKPIEFKIMKFGVMWENDILDVCDDYDEAQLERWYIIFNRFKDNIAEYMKDNGSKSFSQMKSDKKEMLRKLHDEVVCCRILV